MENSENNAPREQDSPVTEGKKKNVWIKITAAILAIAVVVVLLFVFGVLGGSKMNPQKALFLKNAKTYVNDSLPGNANVVGTYADSVQCYVTYFVTDEASSKYDNETDYYSTLYKYDIKTHELGSTELKGGLYTAKGEEVSVKLVTGFTAINEGRDLIIVGTNGDHMGKGLIAVDYDIVKGTFRIICHGVGEKIWIEKDRVCMQLESSGQLGGSSNYSFYKQYYDFNGKKVQ